MPTQTIPAPQQSSSALAMPVAPGLSFAAPQQAAPAPPTAGGGLTIPPELQGHGGSSLADATMTVGECAAVLEQQKADMAKGGLVLGLVLGVAAGGLGGYLLARWLR